MTEDETERLYGAYRVTAVDRDGGEITTETVEDTGTFTIEDVSTQAVLNGIDGYKIEPLWIETRKGDRTIHRIEQDRGDE